MTRKDQSKAVKSDSAEAYVYRPYITLRNGKRIYARAYGHKAFRIAIRANKH